MLSADGGWCNTAGVGPLEINLAALGCGSGAAARRGPLRDPEQPGELRREHDVARQLEAPLEVGLHRVESARGEPNELGGAERDRQPRNMASAAADSPTSLRDHEVVDV